MPLQRNEDQGWKSSRGEFWAGWRQNPFLEARGKEVTNDKTIK